MDTYKRSIGMQIVSQKEGAFIGKLDDFQFDFESREIYGWRIRRRQRMFRSYGGGKAIQLLLVGQDVALIEQQADVEWNRNKKNQVDGRGWASEYLKVEVLNRSGHRVGSILDFVIDPAGNELRGLILENRNLLPLTDDVVLRTESVIIPSSLQLVSLPEEESSEGWWQKIRSVFVGSEQDEPTAN